MLNVYCRRVADYFAFGITTSDPCKVMKVDMKSGRWLVSSAIVAAVGLYRHWDTLSLIFLALLLFTAAIRFWVAVSAPGFERRVANMKPEQSGLYPISRRLNANDGAKTPLIWCGRRRRTKRSTEWRPG